MITAMAAGELDIANLAYPSLPVAIQNAGMQDLQIIADDFQDGNAGYYSNEYMVRADGPIRKIEELKGKVVATNAARERRRHRHARHAAQDRPGKQARLHRHRGAVPDMRAMLVEKKVDLVPAVLPFSHDPELRKIGRPLFTSADAVGVSQFTMWTARQSFIENNRAAMVDFMEDTLRIVRWYLDPANRQEVMEICARITKQRSERFAWVFTDRDYYRDRNLLPDLAALQRNVNLTHDLGLIKASFDVAKFADLSVVREAVKRLQ